MSAPATTLSPSVALVAADWEARRAFSAFTIRTYGTHLHRFAAFAEAHGVVEPRDVDAELVEAFVCSRGRDRNGAVYHEVGSRTRQGRRAALRAFYAAAIENGWAELDPSATVAVPGRKQKRTLSPRPLTDDEVERVRFLAGENPSALCPSAVVLQLAGAWASEVSTIAVDEFDPRARTVRLRGSNGNRPRAVELDEDGARVVAARLDWLRAKRGEPPFLLYPAQSLPHLRQTKAFMNTRRALLRAGIADNPAVTPASLTLWAALREFEATGRIEAAAKLVGSSSLDTTAQLVGWDWGAQDPQEGDAG